MTSISISAVSLSLFNAIFHGLKKLSLLIFSKIIKAPLASLIIVIMVAGYSLALINALFWQANQSQTIFSPPTIQATDNIALSNKFSAKEPNIAPNRNVQIAPTPAMPKSLAKITHNDIINLQQKLTLLGFYQDKIDGFYGPNTAKAIRAFEISISQKPTGAISAELLHNVEKAKLPTSAELAHNNVAPSDPLLEIVKEVANNVSPNENASDLKNRELIKQIQTGLASLGFLQGKIDGIAGEATQTAIRNFEIYNNYQVTGKISPELLDLLKQAGAKI